MYQTEDGEGKIIIQRTLLKPSRVKITRSTLILICMLWLKLI
jgi:hypothetical protein